MSQYIYLPVKKLGMLFAIPLLVELVFFILLELIKKNEIIAGIHSVWYLAAAAVIFFVSAYQIIQCYYVGHDSLWKVLPYSKEVLELIDLIIYILGTLIFGMVYQVIQSKALKSNFDWTKYLTDKSLSLASFYLLLMAACVLFKNIQKPVIGRSLIGIATGAIIILQITAFWQINKLSNVSFMFSNSSDGSLRGLAYINILPFIFFNMSSSKMTALVNSSILLNGCVVFISLAFIFISAKTRKLNYIDLIG